MNRLLLFSAFAAIATAQTCDRECLRGFTTRYLDAMVAHNLRALPLADKIRVTENSAEIKPGEGLWRTASAIGTYRLDILDVPQGVAASHVIVQDSGMPVMLSLRLKVANGKISEIETMTTRSRTEGAIFTVDTLKTARPEMTALPNPAKREPRLEAIRLAEFYPAGLRVGSFVQVEAPFAPNAYRIENGGTMAGPGCSREGCQNIKTQRIIAHPALTSRVMAVDEEAGIVLLWMNFGDTNSYGPGNALIVWEAFKVHGGQIHAVEAFMRVMPASTKSGWE